MTTIKRTGEGLLLRCPDCGHHLIVETLNEVKNRRCTNCGVSGQFKAVPLKNGLTMVASSHSTSLGGKKEDEKKVVVPIPFLHQHVHSTSSLMKDDEEIMMRVKDSIRDEDELVNGPSLESSDDFVSVRELELGIYQINLDSLLRKKTSGVLTAGVGEGIYVIRLPAKKRSQPKKEK